ncbi:MAG: ISBma1, transposase, partial [uncultured Thiotrichaceae bacterium]
STDTEGECRCCGRPITRFHEYDRELKIRHLPIPGQACYLYIRLPRFRCDHCPTRPTTTHPPGWRDRKSSYTKIYEQHLLKSLMGSTMSDVCRQEGITEGCLSRVLERYVQPEVDWHSLTELGQLGIDEIALKKGRKDFVTLITSRLAGENRILGVLKGREKETVKAFLQSIPKPLRRAVQSVCSDLYVGFLNAAREVFGKRMRIVADRFHVARLYRKGLDTLRKQEMRRLKKVWSQRPIRHCVA